MIGAFREGEYVTADGEAAIVQRYPPHWVWVVTVRRGAARATMPLDETMWASLRERSVSDTFHTSEMPPPNEPRFSRVG